jgi:hypothetical protein
LNVIRFDQVNVDGRLRQLESKLAQLLPALGDITPYLERCREIGETLLEAKDLLPHGDYARWAWERFRMKRQTSQQYTYLAQGWEFLPANDWATSRLTLTDAVKAIRGGRRTDRRIEGEKLAAAAIPYTEGSGIITGDSLDWLRAQPDDSVAACVTDAPYGLGIEYDGWREASNAEEHWNWLKPYWIEMKRIVQPGGVIVIWQGYKYLRHLQDWFEGCLIVANCYTARKLQQWEPICKWTKPGGPVQRKMPAWNDWILSDMFDKSSSRNHRAVHPCPKGLKHCQRIIDRYTVRGSLVVDPFCGVGTIPLACKLEGRGFIGIERSEKFASLARRRIETEVGESVAKKTA